MILLLHTIFHPVINYLAHFFMLFIQKPKKIHVSATAARKGGKMKLLVMCGNLCILTRSLIINHIKKKNIFMESSRDQLYSLRQGEFNYILSFIYWQKINQQQYQICIIFNWLEGIIFQFQYVFEFCISFRGPDEACYD